TSWLKIVRLAASYMPSENCKSTYQFAKRLKVLIGGQSELGTPYEDFDSAKTPDNRTLGHELLSVESRLDRDWRPDGHHLEQLPNVTILQGDAAPGPVAAGAIAVNVDIAAEFSVLRWRFICLQRLHDRVVLRPGDQAVSQSSLGMYCIRITDAE